MGIVALFLASCLFSSYRVGKVFTSGAAKKLTLVGWALVLLAPVSIVAETLGVAYLSRIASPAKLNLELSLSDGDVYAIVFGLLIVVVGHVTYEAPKLSEENRAFV